MQIPISTTSCLAWDKPKPKPGTRDPSMTPQFQIHALSLKNPSATTLLQCFAFGSPMLTKFFSPVYGGKCGKTMQAPDTDGEKGKRDTGMLQRLEIFENLKTTLTPFFRLRFLKSRTSLPNKSTNLNILPR
jgi:hypothetical protein